MRQIKIVKYLLSDFPSSQFERGGRVVKLKLIIKWSLKKMYPALKKSLNALWAIPAVLIIRIIRPWLLIRVGLFTSQRIGHFISDSHYQVVLNKIGEIKSIDLWATGKVSNYAWYSIIKRQLHVRKFFYQIYFWNLIIPGGKLHQVETLRNSRDTKGIFTKNVTKVLFTDRENSFAINWLKEFGWKTDEPFICLLNRDPSYLKYLIMSVINNTQSLEFYDYHSYRNSSIFDYEKSILWLIESGYWVIRMGKVADQKLTLSNPKLIDYPFLKNKSDLLDVWLFSKCSGCISTGTGIDYLSWAQGIPSLALNYLPVINSMTSFDLITVPKNLYWKNNKVELCLGDYLKHSYFKTSEYEEASIIIQDLNADQILEATVEFITRIESKEESDLEDKLNQELFISKLRMQANFSDLHGYIDPRFKIGSSWLKSKNSNFFD